MRLAKTLGKSKVPLGFGGLHVSVYDLSSLRMKFNHARGRPGVQIRVTLLTQCVCTCV